MAGIRETEFETHFPKFTDEDSKRFFDAHGEVVSAAWRPAPIAHGLVVSFATRTHVFGPMVLNRYVVAQLKAALDALPPE